MTEQEVKLLCKWAVENGNHRFTDTEKELLKQAIDHAKSVEDLLAVALSAAMHR